MLQWRQDQYLAIDYCTQFLWHSWRCLQSKMQDQQQICAPSKERQHNNHWWHALLCLRSRLLWWWVSQQRNLWKSRRGTCRLLQLIIIKELRTIFLEQVNNLVYRKPTIYNTRISCTYFCNEILLPHEV